MQALARQSGLLRVSATGKGLPRRSLLEPARGQQQQQQQLQLPYQRQQQEQQDPLQTQQLAEGKQAAMQDPARDPTPDTCQKLLWFTCLGGAAATPDYNHYIKFLKVAVLSAKRHAPSLVPVLMYGGEPGPVTQWSTEQGGTVVYHTLSFLPELQKVANESWSAKLVRMQVCCLRGFFGSLDALKHLSHASQLPVLAIYAVEQRIEVARVASGQHARFLQCLGTC